MAKHSLQARRRTNRRGMHLRVHYGDAGNPSLYWSGWITLQITRSAASNLPALVGDPADPPVLVPPDVTEITVPGRLFHA